MKLRRTAKPYRHRKVDAVTRQHLERMIRLLKYAMDHHGRLPDLHPAREWWEEGSPLWRHIDLLDRLLANTDARVVFGQAPGSGSNNKPRVDHDAIARAYFNVRYAKGAPPTTHRAACAAVRAQRSEWRAYKDDTIKRYFFRVQAEQGPFSQPPTAEDIDFDVIKPTRKKR